MAKYCKYCGKELKQGKSCDCQKNTTKEEKKNRNRFDKAKDTIKTEMSNSSKKYFEKFGTLCKNILVNPKEAMYEFVQKEDVPFTMILITVSSLILAFCTVSFLKGIVAMTISGYGDSTMYPNMIREVWNFSYFKILFCVFLGLYIGVVLLAVLFQLGFERVNQKNLNFKKILSVISVSMVEPTFICIASAFFTVFSYKLSILLLLYGVLLFLFNLYQNMKYAGEIESSAYNRLFSVLLLLFLFLAIYLIPNLFL